MCQEMEEELFNFLFESFCQMYVKILNQQDIRYS